MDLDHVRSEIEHMRVQVGRQRKEILQLQRAGIGTASAELLLGRMLAKIEDLCAERDRQEEGSPTQGRLAAGVGDGRAPEMARREGGQLAMDQRARRTTSASHTRGLLLSTLSRRSPSRSTSTQRRRWATAITFSTNPTVCVRFAALASE
jgi:hypothetical protein